MKDLCIISTCYNEELNVQECYENIKNIMLKNNINYEHIFSDNCSTDNTVRIIENICKEDSSVKLLVNSKNYGPFLNNFNALKFTNAKYVLINYASDMQDPPEVIISMYNKIKNGFDAIYGVKTNTVDNFLLKNLRRLFYYILNKCSDTYLPMNVNEFILVRNELVLNLIKVHDYFPYIRGYVAKLTDNFEVVQYERLARKKGKSKNSFLDLYSQAMNGLIFTMNKSVRFFGITFLFFGLISVVVLLSSIFLKIFFPEAAPKGVTILICLITFFFAITVCTLSLILEYVLAIHSQIRGSMEVQIKYKKNF